MILAVTTWIEVAGEAVLVFGIAAIIWALKS